jgi:hypothetical protein
MYNFNENWDYKLLLLSVKNKRVNVIYSASNDVMLNHISLPCIKTTELNIPTATE